MNILLWILQSLLAAHTFMGAIWKFSNPAKNIPSLAAIPVPVWTGLSFIEILCAAGLVLPALGARFAQAPAIAASVVAGEMLLFCVLHLASGEKGYGPLVYWLVVAALGGCVVLGRIGLTPH